MGSIVKCIVRSSTCISQPWLKPHAFLTGLRSEFLSEISDAISFSYGILAGRVEVEIADGEFEDGLLGFASNTRQKIVFKPRCDSRIVAKVDRKETLRA